MFQGQDDVRIAKSGVVLTEIVARWKIHPLDGIDDRGLQKLGQFNDVFQAGFRTGSPFDCQYREFRVDQQTGYFRYRRRITLRWSVKRQLRNPQPGSIRDTLLLKTVIQ